MLEIILRTSVANNLICQVKWTLSLVIPDTGFVCVFMGQHTRPSPDGKG